MLSLKNYLWVFFLSMVPVLELRAAIPIGATLGLEWVANYLICVIVKYDPRSDHTSLRPSCTRMDEKDPPS